jgi:NAD(P)H-dependent FMN reductase
MTTKPRIAIVIGSTRPGRYADKAAGWILKQAQARDDIEAELLDLLDHPLPVVVQTLEVEPSRRRNSPPIKQRGPHSKSQVRFCF